MIAHDMNLFPFLELHKATHELQYPEAQKLFANKFANISFDTIQWTNPAHACGKQPLAIPMEQQASWWCTCNASASAWLVIASACAGASGGFCAIWFSWCWC